MLRRKAAVVVVGVETGEVVVMLAGVETVGVAVGVETGEVVVVLAGVETVVV